MPYGVSTEQEIFQSKTHEALEGLNGVACIADNILIYECSDTVEEAQRDHNKNLLRLLDCCRQYTIRLNKEKMKLNCDSDCYIGHELIKSGLKLDSRKLEAIVKIPPPSDCQGVM